MTGQELLDELSKFSAEELQLKIAVTDAGVGVVYTPFNGINCASFVPINKVTPTPVFEQHNINDEDLCMVGTDGMFDAGEPVLRMWIAN